MNVKAGDLAIAVEGEFAGTSCSVRSGWGYMTWKATGESMFMWEVEFSRPVAWEDMPNPHIPNIGVYPDKWLRKISDKPETQDIDQDIKEPA